MAGSQRSQLLSGRDPMVSADFSSVLAFIGQPDKLRYRFWRWQDHDGALMGEWARFIDLVATYVILQTGPQGSKRNIRVPRGQFAPYDQQILDFLLEFRPVRSIEQGELVALEEEQELLSNDNNELGDRTASRNQQMTAHDQGVADVGSVASGAMNDMNRSGSRAMIRDGSDGSTVTSPGDLPDGWRCWSPTDEMLSRLNKRNLDDEGMPPPRRVRYERKDGEVRGVVTDGTHI